VCNFGSKGEKGRGGHIRVIFEEEEGETLKLRSTGHVCRVKKRTLPMASGISDHLWIPQELLCYGALLSIYFRVITELA